MILWLVNHMFAGTKHFEIKRKLLNSIGWKIGENTKIVGPVFNTGTLEIGKDSWIGKDFKIHGNGKVVIGDRCDIAPEVIFLTGGHEIGDKDRRAGAGQTYFIEVGNGTWIGARATIMGDTKIGRGSVIAACACVTKSIEQDSLAGGVPAKVIRKLDGKD